MVHFKEYPFINFNDLNLDWVIEKIKETDEKLSKYLESAVIHFGDPIQWNITSQYTQNTMVIDSDGTAYLAKVAVPSGIDITNEDYWQPIFNYDDSINMLRSNIALNTGTSGIISEDRKTGDIVWFNGTLYTLTRDLSAGARVIPSVNADVITFERWIDYIKETADEALIKVNEETETRISEVAALNEAIRNESETREREISKLESEYLDITNEVLEYDSFADAVNSPLVASYIGKIYNISSPIELTDRTIIFDKTFNNCVFNLSSNMFTWTDNYMPIPTFVNCVFNGYNHSIVDDNLYITKSKFINCVFIDCALINNGKFVQSTRFDNCRFVGNKTIINSLRAYDIVFDNCQGEADFTASVLVTTSKEASQFNSISQVRVENCIFESTNNILFSFTNGGDIAINNCYFESVNGGIIDVNETVQSNPIVRIVFDENKVSVGREPFIRFDGSYNSKGRVYVECNNNYLDDNKEQHVINTSSVTLWNLWATNNVFGSGNVKFRNNIVRDVVESFLTNTVTVNRLPSLLVWDNSLGGWNIEVVVVHKRSGALICMSILDKARTYPVTDKGNGTYEINISARPATGGLKGATPLANVLNYSLIE